MKSKYRPVPMVVLTLVGLCTLLLLANPMGPTTAGHFDSPLPRLFRSPLRRPLRILHNSRPLTNDAFEVPKNIHEAQSRATREGYGPTGERTSDYMLGSVAVAIILPESDGSIDPNTEDWTLGEKDSVRQEIAEGLNWWMDKARGRGIALDFILASEYPITVLTSYEPISRPGGRPSWGSHEHLWIDEVMAGLGYDSHSLNEYLLEVRDYDNDLREANHTDWAFTIFVVDSSHDVDPQTGDPTPGMFSNWISAYAWIAGPHIVLTRDNDGWEFDHMGDVLAHEIGHLFGAPDEVAPSWSCQDSSSCQVEWGYLSEPNQNCQVSACSRPDGNCIMIAPRFGPAGNYNTICEHTEAHIGWRDSDSDGLPDPVDTAPQLTITGYPPDPSPSHILAYSAQIADIPYPATQPGYVSVTINPVSVQYQVGSTSGAWRAALPADEAWDSPYEEGFKIPIFDNGTYTIYLRAINEVGGTSAITNHTITVDSTEPVYRVWIPLVLRNH